MMLHATMFVERFLVLSSASLLKRFIICVVDWISLHCWVFISLYIFYKSENKQTCGLPLTAVSILLLGMQKWSACIIWIGQMTEIVSFEEVLIYLLLLCCSFEFGLTCFNLDFVCTICLFVLIALPCLFFCLNVCHCKYVTAVFEE